MSVTIQHNPFVPTASNVSIKGRHFVDEHGRVIDLRGANVGSASKVPIRPSPPLDKHSESSYIGRPFPLEEADEHWERLKSWGMNFFRINVTWDALEHAGPGLYDQEYLAYLRAILQSMQKHGLAAYIDVFSRYCGGSGAPGWTLEAAGFDLSNDGEKLALSGAAFLDGVRGGRLAGERGLWPTGYQKLACATMNTLFWGGSTFAPAFKVKDRKGKTVNIQDFLQESFLSAVQVLVDAVGDMEGVLGIELMNEPHPGFIGLPSVHEWNYNTDLHLGQYPSPLQSFSLGAGHPTKVQNWTRSFPWPTRATSTVLANPTGANVWRNSQCPWEKEGVWRWSDQKKQAVALQEDYFTKDRKGKKIDYYQDFFLPFVKKWDQVISQGKMKGKMRMVAPIPNEFCPAWPDSQKPQNFVYAPHWYDLNALFKKQFGFMTVNVQGLSRGMFILNALYFGREGAKKNYNLQISNSVNEARKQIGDVPIVFGECGVPMDMNNESAFRDGNFKWQERMMDSLISALESSLVGFNLWAYNPASRDDIGDDWNAEHFSWYSDHNRDIALQSGKPTHQLESGSRLLNVIVRPYAVATAGTPLSLSYDYRTAAFSYRFKSIPQDPDAPTQPVITESNSTPSQGDMTEIFLPKLVYSPTNIKYSISSGGRLHFDWENQRLFVHFKDVSPDPWIAKIRRIDIWVPDRAWATADGPSSMSWWQWLSLGVVIGVAIYVVLVLQFSQWEREARVGIVGWEKKKWF